MTDWITFPVIFNAFVVIAIIVLLVALVQRKRHGNHTAPPPSTRGAASAGEKKGDTSSPTGGESKAFSSSLKGGSGILKLVVGLAVAAVLLYFGYQFLSWARGAASDSTSTHESSNPPRAESGTAPRSSLVTKCPRLSRGEQHTCAVQTAMSWTYFETGPQVAGYQVAIFPDYDLDRKRPEDERVYQGLYFLLDDGTIFRYEGKPPPRMAIAFRAAVSRPTEFSYRMELVR